MAGEVLADIRNRADVEGALTGFQPALVIHLAAHAYLDGSYEFPADIFAANVMGTVGLLEAIRKSGRRIPAVVVTSDKCYAQGLEGKPCRGGGGLFHQQGLPGPGGPVLQPVISGYGGRHCAGQQHHWRGRRQ